MEEVIQGLSRVKMLTVKELEHANDASIAAGYNRNLYFDKFKATFKKYMKRSSEYKWRGVSKTFVMLQPIMIHEHKHGVRCESHVRCLICTGGCWDFLTLDLPIDYYESLTSVEH